ncbi:acyltransferase [Algibacter sp.]|nr:acyltransferase [Algibacter sp.]
MKVSKYLSKKLSVISFIGIVFIIFIHSTLLNVEQFKVFWYTQAFLRNIWNSFYPMFFSISGYLFFIGLNGSKKEFLYKFKSRFKSLFIPYVFWNVAFIVVMLTLKYNPLTGAMINGDFSKLFSLNFFGWLYELFLKPIGFHLWFVRDLMFMVLISPLIWYLIKKAGYFFILITVLFNIYFNQLPLLGSLVPFSLGALLAINNRNIEKKISNIGLLILLILTGILGFLRIQSKAYGELEFYYAWIPFLLIWFGYDYLSKKGYTFNVFLKWLPYTFFIYVFHEPYLNISKKILLKISYEKEWGIWSSYFLSPLFTLASAIIIAKILEKYTPKFYKIITGGRN